MVEEEASGPGGGVEIDDLISRIESMDGSIVCLFCGTLTM